MGSVTFREVELRCLVCEKPVDRRGPMRYKSYGPGPDLASMIVYVVLCEEHGGLAEDKAPFRELFARIATAYRATTRLGYTESRRWDSEEDRALP